MHNVNYPILKVLLPYIFGILLVYFVNFSLQNCKLLALIILSILLIISVLYAILNRYLQQYVSLIFYVVPLLLGILFTYHKYVYTSNPIHLQWAKNCTNYSVFVVEKPQEKKKSVKILVKIEKNEICDDIDQLAILYLPKSNSSLNLKIGDILLLHTKWDTIPAPNNPYMFDNKSYMKRRGVLFSSYVPSASWQLLAHRNILPIKCFASRVQSYFSSLFKQNGLQGEEYAIITAILLGNDETMEPELKAKYASAGVSHILCVSGMHVGIIFMIFNTLLMPLDGSHRLRFVKAAFLIVIVWLYANITGLAPSVMRSATMFTFVIIGGQLRRHTNVFHSLFASLFFLLLINPLLIFELGFQMSYLAVFGIVIIQPKLASLLKFKTRVGKYFGDLVTVSIAAQLATGPIAIYYFGQFPNYFLLANISVITLSFVVVVSGVCVLAISWWPWLATKAGSLLTWEIKIMNYIISTIDSFPHSVTEMIPMDIYQVLLIYGIIIGAVLYVVNKRKIFKYSFLSFIILLGSYSLYQKNIAKNNENILIYSVDKSTAIHIVHGYDSYLLLDSCSLKSETFYNFYVKNFERMQRLKSQYLTIDTAHYLSDNFAKKGNILEYNGIRVFLLSGETKLYPTNNPLKVNTLYVMNNAKCKLNYINQCIDFERVVIDGSNSSYYENLWCDSCMKYDIPYYSTRESGYLRLLQ